MNQISVVSSVKRYQFLVRRVKKIAGSFLAMSFPSKGGKKSQRGFVEIFLVSDIKMRKLNHFFRKKDKATNVLSFPAAGFSRPDLNDDFLGEIYLAPAYIASKNQDIAKLVIHGFLHLFGYDHKTKNDRIEMEALEEDIFRKLI